jgi:hypothetical protein
MGERGEEPGGIRSEVAGPDGDDILILPLWKGDPWGNFILVVSATDNLIRH